ncbi:MAG: CoA-transferase [Gallicola sp.]|nr:CoA-transferase [Gallicola sp.]
MERKTYDELKGMIKDGDVVAFTTFGIAGLPMEIMSHLVKEHKETQHPKDLTLISANNLSDYLSKAGFDEFVEEGMVKRIITNILSASPITQQAINDNKIEAYLLPQGAIATHYRNAMDHSPGLITKIGLHTQVDPRQGGGKTNDITNKDIVNLIEIDGEEYLHYIFPKVDVLLLRATYADESGNLFMTHEAYLGESFHAAAAVKNNGGKVIVQVKEVIPNQTRNAQEVVVPGELVDYVVVNENTKLHRQLPQTYYDPTASGEAYALTPKAFDYPFDIKKVMLRRASKFLKQDDVVGIGYGISNDTSHLLIEEEAHELVQLNLDLGILGGYQGARKSMGYNYNSSAKIPHDNSWDLIYGGGLDVALLSFAEVDQYGNVNVSQLGDIANGMGGFIDIAQSVNRLIFTGTFMLKSKVNIEAGKLNIVDQGVKSKFVENVQQIDFNGQYAKERGQEAFYVTDRAVFELTENGLKLIEIVSGLDVQTDILDHLNFEIEVASDLAAMDESIFHVKWGGLRESLLGN